MFNKDIDLSDYLEDCIPYITHLLGTREVVNKPENGQTVRQRDFFLQKGPKTFVISEILFERYSFGGVEKDCALEVYAHIPNKDFYDSIINYDKNRGKEFFFVPLDDLTLSFISQNDDEIKFDNIRFDLTQDFVSNYHTSCLC